MDDNISNLLSGVLSDPASMNRIMTLLPVVSQALNNNNSNQSSNNNNPQVNPTINQTTQNNSTNNNSNQNNIMQDQRVAAALQNLIEALNNAQINTNQNDSPNEPSVTTFAPTVDEQINETATETTSEPENIIVEPVQENNNTINNLNGLGSLNIEKTLGALKNAQTAANPENDHRAKLLLSLKPFLRETRRDKIDTAIKYINAAKIFNLFGKNGFV